MDKNIENYLKDKNIINIMNKVSFPYKNNQGSWLGNKSFRPSK